MQSRPGMYLCQNNVVMRRAGYALTVIALQLVLREVEQPNHAPFRSLPGNPPASLEH